MKAKHRFREGWIMLLRPFKFAELKNPLQKMTILYGYTEKTLFDYELNDEGKKLLERIESAMKAQSFVSSEHDREYSMFFGEKRNEYETRMQKEIDFVYERFATVEVFKGNVVTCYVEGVECKFFPDEYNVISRETFEHLLTCDEQEYKVEIEDSSFFDIKTMRDKLFYIRSRGINKSKAQKMLSSEAKDSVIFRPQPAILEMFCREHEIY